MHTWVRVSWVEGARAEDQGRNIRILAHDMKRFARCGLRALRVPPPYSSCRVGWRSTICARTRQGTRGSDVGRVSLEFTQGRVMKRVHLILDEGSARYRRPTLRCLGEGVAIICRRPSEEFGLPFIVRQNRLGLLPKAGVISGACAPPRERTTPPRGTRRHTATPPVDLRPTVQRRALAARPHLVPSRYLQHHAPLRTAGWRRPGCAVLWPLV